MIKVFIAVLNYCFGQKVETDYLLALIAVHNDINLQKTIQSTFGKDVFGQRRNLLMSLEESIEFIDLGYIFYNQYDLVDKSGLDFSLIKDRMKFKVLYFFEPIYMDSFQGILPNSSKLKILFSKRIGNVLAAEIFYSDNKIRDSKITMGKRLVVLFFFNEDGRIIEIISREIIHN